MSTLLWETWAWVKEIFARLMGYTASFDVIAVRFNYRFNCISSDYRSCILDWNSPASIRTLDWSGWEDHAFCPVFMWAKRVEPCGKTCNVFHNYRWVGNQFTIEFGCTNHLIPFPLWSMWKYISFDFLLCLVLPRFEALFWSLLFTHSTLPLKVFGKHILRSTTKSLFDSCGILWFCNFPSNSQPYLQHCLWSLKCSLNSDLNNHRCVFLCLGIKPLEIVIFARY